MSRFCSKGQHFPEREAFGSIEQNTEFWPTRSHKPIVGRIQTPSSLWLHWYCYASILVSSRAFSLLKTSRESRKPKKSLIVRTEHSVKSTFLCKTFVGFKIYLLVKLSLVSSFNFLGKCRCIVMLPSHTGNTHPGAKTWRAFRNTWKGKRNFEDRSTNLSRGWSADALKHLMILAEIICFLSRE